MDAFNRLVEMVPPPKSPRDAGDEEHVLSVELMLGLRLPTDFKKLILTYGSGCWQQFWYILNPNTANQHLNFIAQSQNLRQKAWSALDSERLIREDENYQYAHPIYPDPGGILCWAKTDNGGRLFWLTEGEPDAWPIVYYANRDSDFCVYNMTCTELVYGAVSGTLSIFVEEFGLDFQYGRADAFLPQKYS